MAIGDGDDILGRMRAVMPPWFPNVAIDLDTEVGEGLSTGAAGPPLLAALLSAYSSAFSFIYGLLAYIRLQTRIKTATDGWLDLIAYDFFGLRIQRGPGQSDSAFANTIITEIFRIRNTRAAIIKIMTDLTGKAPLVFEPWRDGPYLNRSAYWNVTQLGSRGLPFQCFVIAYRNGSGVSDAQIYAALDSVKAGGTTIWAQIQN